MAIAPLTFLEQRWNAGYSNDNLIRAARQSTERRYIPLLDNDSHRSLSNYGRRTLLSVGRWLYWNCSPVRAAIDEIARLTTSTFIPQFYGADKAWGREAEDWLYESDKFLDVRGWPYNAKTLKQNLVREVLIDGDLGILLTHQANETPAVQVWKSHRIGSSSIQSASVAGGPYDGARLIDGVVLDAIGRPIAYAINPDDSTGPEAIRYVSANNFLLCFMPTASDQVRGISLLGASVFDWQDVTESREFELFAQKIGATFAMEIRNESGLADRTKSLLQSPSLAPDSSGNAQALPQEIHSPGRVMYFKAGTNQGLNPIKNDRPSPNALAFQDEIIRSSLAGMGWSFDFSHNPTKAGGAQMRIVIDKINRRLDEIRCLLVEPVCRRIDGYRIAKAIKGGFLPENPDWYKWTYQGPAKLTADEKYSSDVSIQEMDAGLTTLKQEAARRGEYWEDVQDDAIEVEKRLQARCQAEGIDPNRIRVFKPGALAAQPPQE
jgi:capsid protein